MRRKRFPLVNVPGEALLQAALASMPYGFSLWNDERRLILCNERYRELYRFPAERVTPGMSLLDICELTVELGNHPGMTADELHGVYQQRLDECDQPEGVLESEKAIRGKVIRTTHRRIPGIGWVVMHEDVTEATEQQWMTELAERSYVTLGRRFKAAIENMAHGLSIFDADMRLVTCNRRYREIYKIPEALGRPGTTVRAIAEHRMQTGAAPADSPDFIEVISAELPIRERSVQTSRFADGRVIQVTRSPIEGGGFVSIHQDITEEVERLDSLNASREEAALQRMRFEAAVNNMSQGLCMFDRRERLVVCNNRYALLYRLPPELRSPGTSMQDILAFRFAHGMAPRNGHEAYVQNRREQIARGQQARDEIEIEDGRIIAIQNHPTSDGGWVATHEDITEQRRIEERVRHLARHDALTDLPNRVLLREEMDKLEALIKRDETVAVFCLDLDHFKTVNDTLGHGIGDGVLVEVARRLKAAARESDVVARLGGDEFAMVAHAIEHPRDAAVIADRVVRSIAEPMDIDGHHIIIGASVGISVAPLDGRDAETLLRNADMALYRAKGEGRGTYHFFEKGLDEAVQRRRLLEQGLRVALDRNEFRLMYQPLFDLGQNRVCCFEALLRWDHPEHGVISPADFIPVAEETGVITPVGEWVLREACRTAAAWPEHVRIAVNLSPVQFKCRTLVDQVVAALDEAGLAPERLELEITESLLLADTESVLEVLHRLRGLGVRISLDDFGTGYSSLRYLRSFPFDKIKIDRSFTSEVGSRKDALAIIQAVVSLGHSLGMSTTAEGVETEEQLEAVRAQGCDEVQGFLFSPPLPASGVARLIAVRPPLPNVVGKSRRAG